MKPDYFMYDVGYAVGYYVSYYGTEFAKFINKLLLIS